MESSQLSQCSPAMAGEGGKLREGSPQEFRRKRLSIWRYIMHKHGSQTRWPSAQGKKSVTHRTFFFGGKGKNIVAQNAAP